MTNDNARPSGLGRPGGDRTLAPTQSFTAFAGSSIAAYVARLVLGMAASILTARILGPDGKGILVFLTEVPAMLYALAHLGLGTAFAYRVARGLSDPRVVASYAALAGIVLGLACFGGALLAVGPGNEIWGQVSPWVVVVAMSLVLLLFLEGFLGETLVGRLKIHHRNFVLVSRSVFTVALTGLFLGLFKWGVAGGVLASLGSLGVAVSMQFFFVLRFVGFRLRLDRELIRKSLTYGILTYLLLLSNTLVYRIDIFFVKGWLGDGALGIYSTAAGLAQLFWLLPSALTGVLFPVAAQAAGRKSTHALRLCRLQMALTLVAGPLLAGMAPLVILLYGQRFMPALWPFYALLPGTLILPIFKYLATDLAARGIQKIPLLISLLGLTVDVGLIIWWVPLEGWYGGIVGAGMASTMAYSLMAIVAAAHFSRVRDVRMREIFVPQRSDLQALMSLPGRAWRRIRTRSEH